MNQQPIGVFDSGLGGLTAVRQLRRIMPSENIIYFGDTSRVPYGNRSSDTWDVPSGKLVLGYHLQVAAPDWLTLGPRGFCITEE